MNYNLCIQSIRIILRIEYASSVFDMHHQSIAMNCILVRKCIKHYLGLTQLFTTVADKKVPVSVACNAVSFLFRWRFVSVYFFHCIKLRTARGLGKHREDTAICISFIITYVCYHIYSCGSQHITNLAIVPSIEIITGDLGAGK